MGADKDSEVLEPQSSRPSGFVQPHYPSTLSSRRGRCAISIGEQASSGLLDRLEGLSDRTPGFSASLRSWERDHSPWKIS